MLHVDLPSLNEVKQLSEIRADACVSIYITTSPLREELGSSKITLSNSLKEALQQLNAAQLDKRRCVQIEEKIEGLLLDQDFWRLHANSLAIFVTPDKLITYRLPNRLAERVEVADRFYLKPMLRSMTFSHATDIIALSENTIRVIELFEDGKTSEVTIEGLPKSLHDIANSDEGSNLRGVENIKVRNEQYVRRILEVLRPHYLMNNHPIVLVAAEPLASTFRNANTLPNLVDEVVFKNADHTSVADIVKDVRPVLERHHQALLEQTKAFIQSRLGQRRVSTDIVDIARAATFGGVELLMVDIDAFIPGTVNDEGIVTFAEQDNAVVFDVLDEIAKRALETGAKVLAVRKQDLPPASDVVCAALRYPL